MLSLLEDTFIAVVDGDSLTAQEVVQAVRWQATQHPLPDDHGDAHSPMFSTWKVEPAILYLC